MGSIRSQAFVVLALGACVFGVMPCTASDDGGSQSSRTFYYMTFTNGDPPSTEETPVDVSGKRGSNNHEDLSILEYFWQQLFSGRDVVDDGSSPHEHPTPGAPSPTTNEQHARVGSMQRDGRGADGGGEQLVPMSSGTPEMNCTIVASQFLLCGKSGVNETRSPDRETSSSDSSPPPAAPPKSGTGLFSTGKTLVMVFLAICAGFSGCGLVVILATGTQTFRQRMRIFSNSQAAAEEASWRRSGRDRGVELQSSRAAKPPPRPVVILGPNNDILVGFALPTPERSTSADITTIGSDPAVVTPVSPRNPARLMMSSLSGAVRTQEDPRSPGQPVSPTRVSPRIQRSEE